jgi:branched-chain amino acid transport system ATP-binding protein
MSLLKIQGLKKSFGGLTAVAGVDLEVPEGHIYCVIGPNGAGKSTLFNLISGYYSSDAGHIHFKGREITGFPPQKIVQLGIGRSFQVTNIFPGLTVYENVQATLLYTQGQGKRLLVEAKKLFQEETRGILSLVGLLGKASEKAAILAAGDRKRLELGLVLATDPELLLLDEPTCGMSPHETADTIQLIKEIAQEKSITVLFTEHKMDVVFSIAAYITVMNFGLVMAAGPPDEIRNNAEVQKIYFGEDRCFLR